MPFICTFSMKFTLQPFPFILLFLKSQSQLPFSIKLVLLNRRVPFKTTMILVFVSSKSHLDGSFTKIIFIIKVSSKILWLWLLIENNCIDFCYFLIINREVTRFRDIIFPLTNKLELFILFDELNICPFAMSHIILKRTIILDILICWGVWPFHNSFSLGISKIIFWLSILLNLCLSFIIEFWRSE